MLSLISSVILYVTVAKAYYSGGPIWGNNFGVPGRNASYDYVIVGGGTAGLALAARLAEDTSLTVAVIEAGGFYEEDFGNNSVVPGLGLIYDLPTTLFTNAFPAVDWGLETTPQDGLNNQTYHYWRGRTLGGTSALNNEIYQRGTIGSYQLWAEEVDDSSYTWDEWLPYFQRSVHYWSPDMTRRPANASVPSPSPEAFIESGGPVEVGYINFPVPFGSWAKLAFQELGFFNLTDNDSGILSGGAQYVTQTIAPDMTRSSSQSSFLSQALASNRQNLIVYPRTLAKRIVFDANLTATGVQVTSYQIPYTISASKEVIVSGGTVHSPQLLMVSGIGPASILQAQSVPVLVDLPGVGQNLWDHMLFTLTYQVRTQGLGRLRDPVYFAQAVENYVTNRTGQLANTGFDFVAWEKLPNRTALGAAAERDLDYFPSDWPELEFIIGDASNPADTADYASCIGGLVAPLSRGFVSIASNDTSVLPIFSPNWLTHLTDQRVAIESFKRCRTFFETAALEPVLVGEEFVPGLNITTDEQILAYIQQSATTIYHASGTCKMGNSTDPMAVLDSQARVKGVRNLRVVDASSFPILPPGHPTATLYALAEKIAAEMLAAL
ncbi:hypothetical protein LTS08_003081 [Lithohypha guttulata]|uniref:uncharacterized protein n=1 Tax=Lithohypha guttulata TaxID=1690604 RepID=UPI002DE19E3C|nr:hypothetical protein LTR51_000263 [Lithohypha guttulata]KAK5103663.1 hypothetical protein LTS08_003081 [Lithohypha guttulata]